jgi:ComF family protein
LAQAKLLGLFLRRVCCLCGGTGGIDGRLCGWCRLRLYPASGGRIAGGAEVRSAFLHAGSGGALVRRLKFDGVRAAADAGAGLMAHRLEGWLARADLLVPMPLSRRRRRERGFNQARLLGAGLSRRLGIPLRDGLVREHRPSQVGMDRRSRRDNVRGAYRRRPGFAPAGTVCLVDDVVTTGSSIAEASEALLNGGAGTVIGATLTYRSPACM